MDSIALLTGENQKLKKELDALREENAHMQRQIAMSVGLRYHLMPDVYPLFPDIPQVDIYADQISIADAGGDFFDMFRVDSDHIGVVMADIFDGGREAALYMVAFKLFLSGEVHMGFTPGRLMQVVNDRLASKNEDNLCLSAFYGVYEISTGILTCVNASGEAPLIRRKGGEVTRAREKRSYLMAVMEGIKYDEYQIMLEPGDTLLLYTDGASGAKNTEDEPFGEDRLMKAFASAGGETSADIVGDLQTGLFSFVGERELSDDASFLCLMRKEDEI